MRIYKDEVMGKFTDQMKQWSSVFGKEYTERNPHTVEVMDELYKQQFGLTRTDLNLTFLGNFNRSIRILEVGIQCRYAIAWIAKNRI